MVVVAREVVVVVGGGTDWSPPCVPVTTGDLGEGEEGASTPSRGDPATLGGLLREHAARQAGGEWMEMVADAAFDLDNLTYLGPSPPEARADRALPPNSLLLQLTDGYYLFPATPSLAAERPAGGSAGRASSASLKAYSDGHIREMLTAKMRRSTTNLGNLEGASGAASSSGGSLSSSTAPAFASASAAPAQPPSPGPSSSALPKILSAAEAFEAASWLCSQRRQVHEVRQRRLQARAALEEDVKVRRRRLHAPCPPWP